MSAPFPASALDGVEAAVEPHVRKATDDIYERVMETVQDYLRDNAEWNIRTQIDTAEREARTLRAKNAELKDQFDACYFALLGLKPILDTAESNASGNPEWEFVSARVTSARAAMAKAVSL